MPVKQNMYCKHTVMHSDGRTEHSTVFSSLGMKTERGAWLCTTEGGSSYVTDINLKTYINSTIAQCYHTVIMSDLWKSFYTSLGDRSKLSCFIRLQVSSLLLDMRAEKYWVTNYCSTMKQTLYHNAAGDPNLSSLWWRKEQWEILGYLEIKNSDRLMNILVTALFLLRH